MSDKELPEAGGVAFCDMYTEDGMRIALTARAHDTATALSSLLECIGMAINKHGMYTKAPGKPKSVGKLPSDFDYSFGAVEPDAEFTAEIHADDGGQPSSLFGDVGQQAGYTDHGLVKFKPKDAGLSDRYELEVSEYRVNKDTKQIEFYAGGQYPEIKHNLGNDVGMNLFLELFKGWKPTEDGQRHAFANGPVILAIQCSDKPNSHGNPWHNLSGVRKA